MSLTFVGRQRELEALERAYQQPHATFVPIYGRRRVGKSELILQFCRHKTRIYFVGTRGTRAYQIRSFLRAAADGLGQPWLADTVLDDWLSALKLVVGYFAEKRPGRTVLVLDEFQWLCESSPELPSVLQQLWDQHWQRDNALMLILCGSYIGFMEREVLGRKSPLFGRRTSQILLEPFSFHEAAGFFPHWSEENAARAYYICGGVPYYLKSFAPAQSVDQNIMVNFLTEDAALFREPEFLLREELREVGTYATIMETIAQGKSSHTAIAQFTGLPTSHLPHFLKNLVQLGYVQRRLPLLPGKPSRKQTRYAISDPLLRFWFRFIAPNYSAIRAGTPTNNYQTLVRPGLEAFYGAGFEQLCREALPYLYAAEHVPGKFTVGEFWSPEAQIDVVGLRSDGCIDLGECKWGETYGLARMIRELSAKAAYYTLQGATLQKRLFTRRPLKATPPPGVRLHDLRDLYAAGAAAQR